MDSTDTEASFLNLHLSISNRFVSSKIRNYSDFYIVNFACLNGDALVPFLMAFTSLNLFGMQECLVICQHHENMPIQFQPP